MQICLETQPNCDTEVCIHGALPFGPEQQGRRDGRTGGQRVHHRPSHRVRLRPFCSGFPSVTATVNGYHEEVPSKLQNAPNMQQAQVDRYDSLLSGPANAAGRKAMVSGFFIGFSKVWSLSPLHPKLRWLIQTYCTSPHIFHAAIYRSFVFI